jgi:TRAP-type C4-dicarboxylate transport system permease small subunit
MPINFSEELCVLTLIWMVFSALPLLEKNNAHLNMTALFNVLPKKVQTVLNVIRSFVTIVLSALLCYAGVVVVNRNFSLNTNTQVLDVSYGYVYLVIPAAFALILITRLADILIKNCEDNTDVADGGAGNC